MAKSNSYFSLRRGSTKSQTFSVLRGQQITKDRVSKVGNPKSTAQMRQRALFATAVKFYKHANQNFFKFAFEDKKQRESEYNAFMRHNLQRSTIFELAVSKNEAFPAIGANWQLTQGSLGTPNVSVNFSSLELNVTSVTTSDSTWGVVSRKIMSAYSLQAGDILTVVAIRSHATRIDMEPSTPPRWLIWQFVLDPDSTTPIDDYFELGNGKIYIEGLDGTTACGGAYVFSRNVAGGGLKVSSSYVVNNSVAQTIYDASLNEAYRQNALNSWGATGQAILQGALVQ